MGQEQAAIEDKPVSLTGFDVAIERLLTALLVFMPLALGARAAWSEQVVIIISAVITVCFLLKLLCCRQQGVIGNWAYLPAAAFLLLAVVQLIALPSSFVNIISPNTALLKTELMQSLPGGQGQGGWMTLSFYPYATRHDLRLVLSVVAVFVVVLNVFRRLAQIERLLLTVAVVGGVVAVIALAQDIFGNEKIYWFISSPYKRANSGPFINHNNFAQFMNLSIGAAFGLLIVKLNRDFAGRAVTAKAVFEYLRGGSAKLFWLLVAVISLGVAAIFTSLSRGGVISTVIAGTFTVFMLTRRRSLKASGWLLAVIALVAFICVLCMGFDVVYDRLATLGEFEEAQASRPQIRKDILTMVKKFPAFGIGLGTHSVVYPMFDRSTISLLAAHAENEYAQAAEETGLVGLGILVIFAVLVWLNYARSIGRNKPPICLAAYGLGFGLAAILVHSLSDFGQHVPANSVLSSLSCALLMVFAKKGGSGSEVNRRVNAKACKIVFVCMVLVWGWFIFEANNARLAEGCWKKALKIEKALAEKGWQGTDAEYADLLFLTAAASDYEPENIKYSYWLEVYRWHKVSSNATDSDTQEVSIPESLLPVVYDVVEKLHAACRLCPTYGPAYSTVGQIEKFILGDDAGAKKIRLGFRLAPCDPTACFVAGKLDVLEGKTEESIEKFKKAVLLDRRLFRSVVDMYVNYLSRPDLAILAAGDDVDWLSYLTVVFEDMQYSDLAEQVCERIKKLLKQRCSQPNPPASAFASLGSIYRKQQDAESAIACYRRALTLNYGQVHWRLILAHLLAESEQIQESMHQARICLQLRPQLRAAEKLIAELSVHPAAFSQEAKLP